MRASEVVAWSLLGVSVLIAATLLVLWATRLFDVVQGTNFPVQQGQDRPLCHGGAVKRTCVVPIGYVSDPSSGTQLVCNGFSGGVSLPLQMLGSTFDGALYNWNSQTRAVGSRKWGVVRVEGVSNGITMITWGADRDDDIGLENKTTVEQCTGYGPIMKKGDDGDVSAGWETGVIYMADKSNADVLEYSLFAFIHIFKIVLDKDGNPTKMKLWEALIENERDSYKEIERLKNNIGAENLFGTSGAQFASLKTTDKYIGPAAKNDVFYIETSFDLSRGIDVPPPARWIHKSLVYSDLFDGEMPV